MADAIQVCKEEWDESRFYYPRPTKPRLLPRFMWKEPMRDSASAANRVFRRRKYFGERWYDRYTHLMILRRYYIQTVSCGGGGGGYSQFATTGGAGGSGGVCYSAVGPDTPTGGNPEP